MQYQLIINDNYYYVEDPFDEYTNDMFVTPQESTSSYWQVLLCVSTWALCLGSASYLYYKNYEQENKFTQLVDDCLDYIYPINTVSEHKQLLKEVEDFDISSLNHLDNKELNHQNNLSTMLNNLFNNGTLLSLYNNQKENEKVNESEIEPVIEDNKIMNENNNDYTIVE